MAMAVASARRLNGGFRRSGLARGPVSALPPGGRTGWLACGLLLAGLTAGDAASDGPGAQVRFDGTRLDISLDAVLNAPLAELNAVMHDYDRFDRIFPLVVESVQLGEFRDGVGRVRADIEGCILVFCRRLRHVLDVRAAGRGWNSAVSVPAASDVRAGHFVWRADALDAEHTRFRFSGWVEPDVWIPPVIGPIAVRRTVQRSFADALPRLEQEARERAERRRRAPDGAGPATLPAP
ncbi:SRPBCC family protein [Thioalkalivibrio thiocyanodenitrificans]|uniref:SRPBCC family protein n=1 Tax=Thioalkalivibrio thiocyanodenitrificans TaxID=243063 RepID=UPI0003790AE6|nr:SRPBCC family protein [Thioalkalivibrio thiocyanodenitrificans]